MSEPWKKAISDLTVLVEDFEKIKGPSNELSLAKAEIKRLEGLREEEDLHKMPEFLDPKQGSRPSSDGYEVYWEWDENCGRVYRSTQLGEHVWTPGIMHPNALLTAMAIENQIQLEEQIQKRREQHE